MAKRGVGRPQKSADEKRTLECKVWFNKTERAALDVLADRQGVARSQAARIALLETLREQELLA